MSHEEKFSDNEVDIHSQIEFEKVDIKKLSEVEELEVTSGSAKGKEKDKDSSSNVVMVLRKIANHPLLVRCVLPDKKPKLSPVKRMRLTDLLVVRVMLKGKRNPCLNFIILN